MISFVVNGVCFSMTAAQFDPAGGTLRTYGKHDGMKVAKIVWEYHLKGCFTQADETHKTDLARTSATGGAEVSHRTAERSMVGSFPCPAR